MPTGVNHGAVAAKVGRNDSCPCGSGKKYNLNQGPAIRLNPLNGATSNYTYDPIYELTQVVHGTTTTESYSYDGVRNRLSLLGMSQYNYNPSNDLISTPSGSYTYDADGNTLTDASGKACTSAFENRLVQAVVPGTVTFKHDPLGRRIQKSPPSGATNYLYDGMNAGRTLPRRWTIPETCSLAIRRAGMLMSHCRKFAPARPATTNRTGWRRLLDRHCCPAKS